jgi:hypothetical protein
VNVSLSDALYFGGRDFNEIFPLINVAVTSIDSQADRVRNFDGGKSQDAETDNQIREQLTKRYDRARFSERLHLAYLWAEKGLSAREDAPLGEEVVPWPKAQAYAEEAYQGLLGESKRTPWFACIDDSKEVLIKDTYAFVKLAFVAFNVRAKGISPDRTQVTDARMLLEDARARVLDMQRRNGETGSTETSSSCLTGSELRAWMKRISNHLNLAVAMQQR